MKLLATFANAGEAAFEHSLLADAGIAAELYDGSLDIGSVQSARLQVADEDFVHVSQIVATYRESVTGVRSKDEHPAARFPFLGIMGLTAILWGAICVLVALTTLSRTGWMMHGMSRAILGWLAIVSTGLLWGLLIGFGVALICLVATVTWRKLNNASPKRPTERAQSE